MADQQQQCDGGTSNTRQKSTSKRAATAVAADAAAAMPPTAPCGACKFLRRKCINGCIFAPHFSSDQGSARFAAVHKVFGASNVSKLLLHIPMNRRQDAVVTICYEAQARLTDPVYGCVSTIFALQQQVAYLQAELAVVQTRLMNSRLAAANAFGPQQQQQQIALMQPAYSNNSSASNNFLNMSSFNPSFDFMNETTPSSHNLELLQLSRPSHDEEGEEEESGNLITFSNQIMLHPTT